jgi:hypothetical protein
VQVNELQRRQRKEHEKEVKKREKLQQKEKAERAAQAKLKMEEEAYQLQVGEERLVWSTLKGVRPCQHSSYIVVQGMLQHWTLGISCQLAGVC